MTKKDVDPYTTAYGCVNLLIWLVIMALVGVVAGSFFGPAMGFAASMVVLLLMLVGTAVNIKRYIESGKWNKARDDD